MKNELSKFREQFFAEAMAGAGFLTALGRQVKAERDARKLESPGWDDLFARAESDVLAQASHLARVTVALEEGRRHGLSQEVVTRLITDPRLSDEAVLTEIQSIARGVNQLAGGFSVYQGGRRD